MLEIQFQQGTNSGQFVSYIFSDFSLHKPVLATEVSGVSVLHPGEVGIAPFVPGHFRLGRALLGWPRGARKGFNGPAFCGTGFNHPSSCLPSDNNLSKYRRLTTSVNSTNKKLYLSVLYKCLFCVINISFDII